DPKYIRFRDSYPDVLVRRFEATKIKLGDLLGQLVQSQNTEKGCRGKDTVAGQTPMIEVY
ncbi:MAG: hypothetical protein ACLP53_15675, partial [Isosphaeraceae bacterium]